ncbi:unnamed protein product [Rotaria sordida]|uniref:Uncharacterized protein n=1 Tax=Rotaria sordida TaxID=392033 RepID=A0A815QHG6_9BILA|nr:unnamed protein product [Rotaria sordida]CAF1642335.1 unnamed protein product [Rotaria sordida]
MHLIIMVQWKHSVQKKTTIGQRRPTAAKKKDFGVQKVTANFKEIEQAEKQLEKDMANLKFAYQYINKKRELEGAKLKQSNSKKTEQMEYLGMGFGNRSGVSHSAMTDMQTIQQEGVITTRNVSLAPRNRDFFDDYEPAGFSSRSNYNISSPRNNDRYNDDSRKSNFHFVFFSLQRLNDDLFKPKSPSKNTDSFSADWEVIDQKTPTKEFESSGRHSSSYSNYGSSTANSAGYSSSSKLTTQSFTSYSEANGGDA